MDRDRWRHTARIEPNEFFRHSSRALWIYEATIGAVLGIMALWNVSVRWLIVTATLLSIHTVCGFVFDATRRVEGMRGRLDEATTPPGSDS
jgi:hypothetical protein